MGKLFGADGPGEAELLSGVSLRIRRLSSVMGMIGWWRGDRVSRRKKAGTPVAAALNVETLEVRILLSRGKRQAKLAATNDQTVTPMVHQATQVRSLAGGASAGYTPAEIRGVYGFEGLTFNGVPADGSGQTIAIIDAYDHPFIESNLATFDAEFGLPDPPSFQVVNQTGGTKRPKTDPRKIWEGEIALDVEWAHAIAPGANILLVEANSSSNADIFAAVDYARHVPGVSVISMSWGSNDRGAYAKYDQSMAAQYLVTPPGHQGITFIASSGDHGVPSFPSTAPGVLSVGGTNLYLNSDGTLNRETAWTPEKSGTVWSGGGGVSEEFPGRTVPDVAYNGGLPVAVYDTFGPDQGWVGLEGTSAGAPQWAALIAIVNQGRVATGLGTLDGATETIGALYAAPSTVFRDITVGSTEFQPAGVGYDLATGLGVPVANELIPYLVSYTGTTPLTIDAPNNVHATPLTETSVEISWDAVSGAMGYRVFQIVDSKPVLLKTVTGTSTTVEGLTAGGKATFFVESYVGSVVGKAEEVTVTLPAPLPTLALNAKVKSSFSAVLKWNAIAGASEYRIYWMNSIGTVLLQTLGGSKKKAPVTGLTPGITTQFRVEAQVGSSIVDSNWLNVVTS